MDPNVPNVAINLRDLETGVEYHTRLSPNDAHKVQTDIVFASKVLATLKSQEKSDSVISIMTADTETSSETSSETIPSEQCDVEDSRIFKWSHQAILLLIEEYQKREEDIVSGKISQKQVWDSISKILCSYGHDVTGPQCQSKFTGMKRTFKSIKDHNSKSGNNPRSWPYTEIMESLLGEKPFMNPIAVASSSRQFSTDSASDVSLSNSDISVGFSASRKRKNFCTENILESKKISEENKTQRHQEAMNQRSQLLNILDKLVDKLK